MLIKKSMETEANIQIFKNEQFGDIRTAGTSDEPLFCLPDVCRVLGVKQVRAADRLEKGMITKHTLNTSGGEQLTNFVNEEGLYSMVFTSRKPEALVFRKWVLSEVLPTIRKTGGYIVTKENDTEETIKARAMSIAEQTIKRHEENILSLEAQNRKLREEAYLNDKKLSVSIAEYHRRSAFIEQLDRDGMYRLKYQKKEAILNRIIQLCFERGVYVSKDDSNPMLTLVPNNIYVEVLEAYENGSFNLCKY